MESSTLHGTTEKPIAYAVCEWIGNDRHFCSIRFCSPEFAQWICVRIFYCCHCVCAPAVFFRRRLPSSMRSLPLIAGMLGLDNIESNVYADIHSTQNSIIFFSSLLRWITCVLLYDNVSMCENCGNVRKHPKPWTIWRETIWSFIFIRCKWRMTTIYWLDVNGSSMELKYFHHFGMRSIFTHQTHAPFKRFVCVNRQKWWCSLCTGMFRNIEHWNCDWEIHWFNGSRRRCAVSFSLEMIFHSSEVCLRDADPPVRATRKNRLN